MTAGHHETGDDIVAGMDIDTQISAVIHAAIREHTFPGAVVGYYRDGAGHVAPFGRLTYDTDTPAVTAETVYDLASVTKSIPTSCIILKLVEQNKLSFDDPTGAFLPRLSPEIGRQVLIRHLLTFTAVFDMPQPLSSYGAAGKEAVLRAVYDAPLKYPPGQHYHYSNIPSLLLGIIAEEVLGKTLDRIADEYFFGPLRMHHTTFHPGSLGMADIAPTEINGRTVVAGVVHDESARALYEAGQLTGHAGLFSTAGDLLQFCRILLADGNYQGQQYFSPHTIARMQAECVHENGYGVSLGWLTRHPAFVPSDLPYPVFGKQGFTGTLVMVEPGRKRCLVLLSNRTYPKRPETGEAIQAVQRKLLDIFFAS